MTKSGQKAREGNKRQLDLDCFVQSDFHIILVEENETKNKIHLNSLRRHFYTARDSYEVVSYACINFCPEVSPEIVLEQKKVKNKIK